MISPKDVTIIIPHLGQNDEGRFALEQCLKSLETNAPDFKVLVAGNGDYRYNLEDIHVMEQGQCKAVNAAVATTDTPWIMVTNDDMVFPPGWFEKLTEGMTDDMLCISPKLVEPRPGAPTFLVHFAGGAGGDFNYEEFLEFAKNSPEVSPNYLPGFNLPFLIKRELWDLIGGYDINYDPWGSNSDSDLEYKIKLAGVQPMQAQNSLVYHFSQTSGTFAPENTSYWQRNFAYFQEKWGFPRTDTGIWEATFIIPDEGRIYRPEWEGTYANS